MQKRIYSGILSCMLLVLCIGISGCVNPENKSPEASFSIEPSYAIPNEICYCNSSSVDTDGTISNYTWKLGEIIIGYTSEITYSFEENGSYTITLQVTDDKGKSDSIDKSIVVGDLQLYYDKFYGEWNWSGNDQIGQWIFYENNTLKATYTGMAGAQTTSFWIWELQVNNSEIHFTTTDDLLFSGAYQYEFLDNDQKLKITYDGSIAYWYRVEK